MAQFYGNNADSVRDFLSSYNDKQVEGLEDMTDSIQNLKDLKWKDTAESIRAKAQGKAEEGGEILGSLMGVKGLKSGFGKLKDIYSKGKDLKNKVEDIKNKLSGEDSDKSKSPADDSDDKFDDDAVELDDEPFQTAPYQGASNYPTGDQDNADDKFDFDDDAVPIDEGNQPDVDTSEPASDPIADTDDDSYLQDILKRNTQEFQKGATEPDADFPDDTAQSFRARIKQPTQDDAGDQSGSRDVFDDDSGGRTNLDDIFDQSTGGSDEGKYSNPADEATAQDGALPDSESLPYESSKINFSNNTFQDPAEPPSYTNPVQRFPDDGGELNTYSNNAPTNYNVPERISAEEQITPPQQATADESGSTANPADTDVDFGDLQAPRSLGTNVVQNRTEITKNYDLEGSEITNKPEFTDDPDMGDLVQQPKSLGTTIEPPPETEGGAGSYDNPLFDPYGKTNVGSEPSTLQPDQIQPQDITADQEGATSTFQNSRLPAGGDSVSAESGYGDSISQSLSEAGDRLTNIVGQGQQALSGATEQGQNLLDIGENLLGGKSPLSGQTADPSADNLTPDKKPISGETEDPTTGNLTPKSGADAGGDAGELAGEGTGELAGEIGLEGALGAVPVLGEAALVGVGLYEGIKGLIDMFSGDDDSKPPAAKLVAGSGGGNVLSFGGSNLSSKLASSIPSTDNSLDTSGLMSF